jgi:flavin reductase (DIM6/NTAB) family NADH-FMN oxidoreductase RutF
MTETGLETAAHPPESFKAVFRQHPAGVGLITAAGADGPVGLTASSIASVAVDPMTLSFSVTRAIRTAGVLLKAGTISVQLLADHHVDLAWAFARSGEPRFTTAQGWSQFDTGEPLLPDARAALRCRITTVVPVGSSSLVLAEVLEVRVGPQAAPLIYHDRRFRRLEEELPESSG